MSIENKSRPAPMDKLLQFIKSNPLQNALFDGATEEEITRLEEALGHNLPPSYRSFLRFTNGAVLNQVDELFGTKDNEDGLQKSILTAMREIPGLPKMLIPFYCGAEYNFFDASQPQEGEYQIVRWNQDTRAIKNITNSFPDWLRARAIDEYE